MKAARNEFWKKSPWHTRYRQVQKKRAYERWAAANSEEAIATEKRFDIESLRRQTEQERNL